MVTVGAGLSEQGQLAEGVRDLALADRPGQFPLGALPRPARRARVAHPAVGADSFLVTFAQPDAVHRRGHPAQAAGRGERELRGRGRSSRTRRARAAGASRRWASTSSMTASVRAASSTMRLMTPSQSPASGLTLAVPPVPPARLCSAVVAASWALALRMSAQSGLRAKVLLDPYRGDVHVRHGRHRPLRPPDGLPGCPPAGPVRRRVSLPNTGSSWSASVTLGSGNSGSAPCACCRPRVCFQNSNPGSRSPLASGPPGMGRAGGTDPARVYVVQAQCGGQRRPGVPDPVVHRFGERPQCGLHVKGRSSRPR